MTTIYHYDAQSGIYLGASAAALDPLESKPIIPAAATDKKPPKVVMHEAAVFDSATTSWRTVSDYRGTTYWLKDKSKHTITELGVTPPDDALDAPPPPSQAEQLETAKEQAVDQINRAANTAKEEDIDYHGVTYQVDSGSERALTDRIAILQASGNNKATTTWIAADNSKHDLSFADLAALAYAIAERKQRIVIRAREKKDAIAKAKTPETVAQIDLALADLASSK